MTHITVDLQARLEAEIAQLREREVDIVLAAARIVALEWVLAQAGVKRLPPGVAVNAPTRPVLEHPAKRIHSEERRADDEYFRSGTRYPGQ